MPVEQFSVQVDVDIRLLVGPELLAGSTRLKAGTVTKMALNILSTGVMVRLRKVYGNRMIDVAVKNTKLRDRALGIIEDLTELSRDEAGELLNKSGDSVKLALLMHWSNLEKEEGDRVLSEYQGNLRAALKKVKFSSE